MITPLDEVALRHGVDELVARDRDLAATVARHGPPPLWPRPPGFETLVRIILEQQVSLGSAEAAYERLREAAGRIHPAAIAGTGEALLRAAGLTRQKARYVVAAAEAVSAGRLDLAGLATLDDDDVRVRLTALPGIGPWSAEVYLLMALRRPDAFPSGDIALAASAQRVMALATRPSPAELTGLAERWRPWRAVAARLLWHAYLSERRADPGARREAKAADGYDPTGTARPNVSSAAATSGALGSVEDPGDQA